MAYHNYDDWFQGGYNTGYNMGYRPPYYERDNNLPYYDLAPVAFRQEPYYDNYRRDYRQGGIYDSRHGVAPLAEDVFRRVDSPHWLDQGRYHDGGRWGGRYHDGGQLGGRYRLDRYNHHGGQDDHGHHHHHGEDDYRRHGNHHSRTAVELYVPVCCDKCERKLRKHLDYIDGVETVTVDQTTKKVVVFGHVNPSHVLNRARQDKPESDFWRSRYR